VSTCIIKKRVLDHESITLFSFFLQHSDKNPPRQFSTTHAHLSFGTSVHFFPVNKVLSHQGAVMFARTNVPQTMLSYECSNPVFGATKNPYDLTRGPGGSSGGEGSLLGSNGSILGIGTDIGGSLRIPAAFSGCCSFKPTAGRISTKGMTSSTPGQESIRSTAGPMAREVDGLVLVLRALWANGTMHQLDPTVPPTPFNDAAYPFPPCSNAAAGSATGGGKNGGKSMRETKTSKPLRVGWFTSDGFAPPTPACARAVEVAKSGLAERGHTVVEFDWLAASGSGTECITLFSQLLGADQGETLQVTEMNVLLDVLQTYCCVPVAWNCYTF